MLTLGFCFEKTIIFLFFVNTNAKNYFAGGLKERAEALGPLDSVFLINTLAAIFSYSHNDASHLVKEIIEVELYCAYSLLSVFKRAVLLVVLLR